MLPKEGIPRPKLPRTFPPFMLVAAATVLTFPHQVRAKITIQDGGAGGATNNATGSIDGGRGGDASVSWVTLQAGLPYSVVVGAGGAGNAAGTTLPSNAGGGTTLTPRNQPAMTSANGNLIMPGGSPSLTTSNAGTSLAGGASFLSTQSRGVGHNYGGGGSAGLAIGQASFAGATGCLLLEFLND